MKLVDFLSEDIKADFLDTMIECRRNDPNFEMDNNLHQMFVINVMLARKIEELKEQIVELQKGKKSAEECLDEEWFE
jgi:hypothetical protein